MYYSDIHRTTEPLNRRVTSPVHINVQNTVLNDITGDLVYSAPADRYANGIFIKFNNFPAYNNKITISITKLKIKLRIPV